MAAASIANIHAKYNRELLNPYVAAAREMPMIAPEVNNKLQSIE